MKKFFLSLLVTTSFLTVNAQTDSLQEYTGTYVFGDGSPIPSVDVTLADGVLTMTSSAGTSVLTGLGVDSFLIVEFSGTAVFKRSEDKKVNAVHIEAMGYVLDGKKQENGIWIFRDITEPRTVDSRLLSRLLSGVDILSLFPPTVKDSILKIQDSILKSIRSCLCT